MGHESPLPIVVVTGATASGKTPLAMALSDRLPVRLISVDSAQVYRGLDIGTAKPEPTLLAQYPHALIDVADPAQPFSAADFVEMADREVTEALQAGELPVLVGGTMLYLQAFRDGLATLPSANEELREQLTAEARHKGWASLYQELQRVDPEAAAQIDPNNYQRLQRALEVYRLTGTAISEWWRTAAGIPATKRHNRPLIEFSVVTPDRAELHLQIARRFDAMLAAGFLDEVRGLRERPDLHLGLPALRAVGYRQLWQYLAGEGTSGGMRERGIAATRQLAKRQLTWLRRWTFMHALVPGPARDQAIELLTRVDLEISQARPHSGEKIEL